MIARLLCLLLFAPIGLVSAQENWPQASGPNLNWNLSDVPAPPTAWSVVKDENILWRRTLPEGGQSAVTVWGDRAFVTTHRPIEEGDDLTEPNIIAYCLDSGTGEILWQRDLPGTDPVQTAGIFSDATVFAPATNGTHVWFFNRCGSMGCFTMDGEPVWIRTYEPRRRHTNRQCEPILIGDLILTVEVRNKEAGQKLQRHKPVPEGIDPTDVWTYLHAINKMTGEVVWVGEPGTAVHNTPMVVRLKDGTQAVVHGRGGGHGPLEKPYGISLTRVSDGKHLWSTELNAICYSNSHANADELFWFTKSEHLVLETATGKVLRTQPLYQKASHCTFDPATDQWTTAREIPVQAGKKSPLTNQTNIVVGDWHYFLSHAILSLGRVHVKTGEVEYLQLPAQKIVDSKTGKDQLIWNAKEVVPNDTKNSRGISIALDKRARGTGWGHVSAASPVAINDLLYIPIMNGTVYVIDTKAEQLNDKALVAINDLGPAGETWNLSSFTASKGDLYIHTMKEVICIGEER